MGIRLVYIEPEVVEAVCAESPEHGTEAVSDDLHQQGRPNGLQVRYQEFGC